MQVPIGLLNLVCSGFLLFLSCIFSFLVLFCLFSRFSRSLRLPGNMACPVSTQERRERRGQRKDNMHDANHFLVDRQRLDVFLLSPLLLVPSSCISCFSSLATLFPNRAILSFLLCFCVYLSPLEDTEHGSAGPDQKSDTEKLKKRQVRMDKKRGRDRKTKMDNDGQGNEAKKRGEKKDSYNIDTRERWKCVLATRRVPADRGKDAEKTETPPTEKRQRQRERERQRHRRKEKVETKEQQKKKDKERDDPPSAFLALAEEAAVAIDSAVPAATNAPTAYPCLARQCMELIVPWRHVAREARW